MKKRSTALMLALVLVVGIAVGGTLAWLQDYTQSIKNTFTIGMVDIDLTETGASNGAKSFKMSPGKVLDKDPKVTVNAGSDACWLFVKIDESANLKTFIEYSVDSAWAPLDGVNGVYYIQVDTANATSGKTYSVLTGDKVTVKSDVTNEKTAGLNEQTYPNMTFTAYAIQQEGFASASAAWTELKTQFSIA